jgi:hypothetical protein
VVAAAARTIPVALEHVGSVYLAVGRERQPVIRRPADYSVVVGWRNSYRG